MCKKIFKKLKNKKAITLIALIVIIILAIILASITLGTVGKIFWRTKNAKEKYDYSLNEEEGNLKNVVGDVDRIIGQPSINDDNVIENSAGNEDIKDTYTVNYDANGGSNGPSKQMAFNTQNLRITSDEPERTGYAFLGWSTTNGGPVQYEANAVYTGRADITLYAVWNANTYNIEYNLDGGTINGDNPVIYTVETNTFSLKNPTKEGYLFAGWTGTNISSPTNTITIEKGSVGNRGYVANWSLLNYSVDDETYYYSFAEALVGAKNTGSTIKVLRNVTDNSVVSVSKNVTLNMNGFNITRNLNMQINSDAALTIVGNGSIENTEGITIINSGTLVLGNNDGTVEENLIIKGTTFGINNVSDFNYYDGTIIGINSINGEVSATPNSYNPVAEQGETLETVKLAITTEAAARIGMHYYSNLQLAIDDASVATPINSETVNNRNVINDPTYGFNYNEEDESLISNNTGKASSVANSYIELDLTNFDGGIITINAEISSEIYDRGYAVITDTIANPIYTNSTSANNIICISGSKAAQDYTRELLGGKKYYLHLGYVKDSTKNSGNDIFKINGISLKTLNCVENQTIITVLKNLSLTETAVIPNGNNIKLDLNSYTISGSGSIDILQNNCNLEIVDTSVEQTGNITNAAYRTILNNIMGNLKITSGTIGSTKAGTSSNYNNIIYNYGIIELNGGNISSDAFYSCGIYNSSGKVNILNGNINITKGNGIRNDISGEVTMTGGSIAAQYRGIYNSGSSKINISGGRVGVIDSGIAIYNTSNNSITDDLIVITGGEIYCDYSGTYSGYYTIRSEGTCGLRISGENTCINQKSKDVTIYFDNGNISITDGVTMTGGIYSFGTGNLKIDDVVINAKIGITVNSNGTINISNSQIETNRVSISVGAKGLGSKNITNCTFNGLIVNPTTDIILNVNNCTINCINKNIENAVYSYSGTINISNSTITMSGTTVNTYSITGIRNVGTGTVNLIDTDISVNDGSLSYKNVFGVYCEKTGGVNLTNSNITTERLSASINYNAYGIYIKNTSTATVNIGNKDGNFNALKPTINAENFGVYNETGYVNLYDGVIKGVTAISGTINDIEVGKEVVKTFDNTIQIVTLADKTTKAARNETTGQEYLTIQEAINSCSLEAGNTQTTITILKDNIYLTNQNVDDMNIVNGQNIALDLNGKTISISKSIENSGKLEIIGDGMIKSTSSTIINNLETGEFILTSGTLKSNISGTSSEYKSIVNNLGKMTINGGTISGIGTYQYGININSTQDFVFNGGTISLTGENSNAINNTSSAKLTINAGTISGQTIGINNESTGDVYIINGTISSLKKVINNNSEGSIYFNGGIVNSIRNSKGDYPSIGIYNVSTGYVEVDGGTINNVVKGIQNYGAGSIVFKDGIITSKGYYTSGTYNGYAIYNSTIGNVEILDGTISNQSFGYTIYNNSTGEITIRGGNFTTGYDACVYNYSTGTINITGGDITSTTEYGVYNNSTGTIKIGEEFGNVDLNVPRIAGNPNGVYMKVTGGNLYYFDGKISGKTNAIYGNPNRVESGYEIISETDETLGEVVHLAQLPVVSIGDVEYSSLQDAVDAIEVNNITPVTINLLRNATILGTSTSTIIENQNIILDLNGFTLTSSIDDTIINRGTLKITDDELATGGTITTALNTRVVNNEGTLTLENINILAPNGIAINNVNEGTVNVSANIRGYNNAINNDSTNNIIITSGNMTAVDKVINNNSTGSVYVNGGTIKSLYDSKNKYSGYGVYNVSTGYIEINEVTMNNLQYGVYNAANGEVLINNSNIAAEGYSYNWSTYLGYTVYNKTTGHIRIVDGIIQNTEWGNCIYNASTGIIDIEGGEFSSAFDECIENNSTGTINIHSGTVTATYDYGVLNNSTGTITLGMNDANVSETLPLVIGREYGVYLKDGGTLNYYDGIIKGNINAVRGSISEVESDYNIDIQIVEGKETLTLKQQAIVSIGETQYYTLQSAIDSVEENNMSPVTISLTKNIAMDDSLGSISITNKNIVLDLNTYTLILSKYNFITNSGTLKIMDSNIDQSGRILSRSAGKMITNSGNLEIASGSLVSQNDRAIENELGTINITGGNITASTTAIYNNTTGTITVTDANIQGDYGIYNNSTGSIYFNGGSIINGSNGIYNNDEGYVEVNGGTINLNGNCIYNRITGIIALNGGNLTCIGDYDRNGYGIRNNGSGTVNISGGTITSDSANYANSIYNVSLGIINMTGGSINSKCTAIYNYSNGIINIEGGSITSQNYAIQNYASSSSNIGIINIGKLAGEVSQSNPEIIGGTFGISNTYGELNFYDGKICGKTGTITGKLTLVEPGYEIEKTIEGEYNQDVLALTGAEVVIASIDSVKYGTLQAAFNTCQDGIETIVKLEKSIEVDTTILVAQNKNIIFDLNGKTITSSMNSSTIQNNGTLSIVDNSTGTVYGTIKNLTGTTITNAGILNLGNSDRVISKAKPRIIGGTVGINTTSGTFNMYDGIICATDAISGTLASNEIGATLETSTSGDTECITLKSTLATLMYSVEGFKIIINGTSGIESITDPSGNVNQAFDGAIDLEYTVNIYGIYTFRVTDTSGQVMILNIEV